MKNTNIKGFKWNELNNKQKITQIVLYKQDNMDDESLYDFFESFRENTEAKQEVKNLLFKYDEVQTKIELFFDKYIIADDEKTKIFQLQKYLGIGSIAAAGITIASIFTYFLLQNMPKEENKLAINKKNNHLENIDSTQNKKSENNENIADKLPKNQTDNLTNGETQKKLNENIKKEKQNNTKQSNREIIKQNNEKILVSPKENDVIKQNDFEVEWKGMDKKDSLEVQIRNEVDNLLHKQIVKNKEKISIPEYIKNGFYTITIKEVANRKRLIFPSIQIELKRDVKDIKQ